MYDGLCPEQKNIITYFTPMTEPKMTVLAITVHGTLSEYKNTSHLNNADGKQKGDPSGRIITEEPKARTRTKTFLLTRT